tara:strand:+ start:68 stop:268 length:201 start_codon:yes stop_codon:yes gene_type:complete
MTEKEKHESYLNTVQTCIDIYGSLLKMSKNRLTENSGEWLHYQIRTYAAKKETAEDLKDYYNRLFK